MIQKLISALRFYWPHPLPIPFAASYSEILVALCRLLGCATIVGIIRVSVENSKGIGVPQTMVLAILVFVVAMTVGNLVKEVAIAICGIAVNSIGCNFYRKRLTLSGDRVNEVFKPDGTWDRYIINGSETIHEWTDEEGQCHREIASR
jgi:hypothetical protein